MMVAAHQHLDLAADDVETGDALTHLDDDVAGIQRLHANGQAGGAVEGRRVYSRDRRNVVSVAHLFAVLALTAALRGGAPEPEIGRPFDMKPDETVTLDGLTITFHGIGDDSRCPTGVTCVWAGDATAAFTFEKAPAAAMQRTLHTNGRFERQTDYDRFVIRLEDVRPYPKSSATIARADYRAALVVTRR